MKTDAKPEKKALTEQAVSRAQEIILREYEKIPGRKQNVDGASVMIVCPFHDDRSPSARLQIAPTERFSLGFMFCYACGAKKWWNEIAAKCGLLQIADRDFKQDRVGNHDLDKLRSNLLGTKRESIGDDDVDESNYIPTNHTMDDLLKSMRVGLPIPFPKDEKWRGVPGWLLNKIGAYMAFDERREDRVAILPVKVEGNTVGAIKGFWTKEKGDKMGYMNSPGPWSRVDGMFPFDYARRLARRKKVKSIVIVEGPRDALRLLRYGIPAVSILGTQNWSPAKASILIDSGLTVIICMDGDEAGEKARKEIKRALKQYGDYKVFNLSKLAPGKDPGNMDKDLVMLLKDNL